MFKNSLVIGRRRRHVVHESAEGLDEVVRGDSAWWGNLDATPVCCWPQGVSIFCDSMDVCSCICRAEGIRRGVGVADDALKRLLCILEVVFPLFPSMFESR